MKQFLMRLLFALALTLVAFAISPLARAQQADEDPSPDRTHPQQPSVKSQAPGQNTAPGTSAREPETQDALAFTGIVSKVHNQILLKDPVTKMTYRFDNSSKVEPYIGKHVKVVGKLGLDSNTIHVNSVQVVPQDENHPSEEQGPPPAVFRTRGIN